MKAEEHTEVIEEGPVAGSIPAQVGLGEQLRAAREAAGLTLDQVAQETRISRRYLVNIEAGEFAELPGRTYAIGFSKSYAKAVGLDPSEVAAMVAAEMDALQPRAPVRQPAFEPGDPGRVPSKRLWLLALVALVVLLVGLFFTARLLFAPAAQLPSLVDQEEAAQQAERQQATTRPARQPAAAVTPAGPVVFTALEEGIWVRFYTADGVQLMQKLMAEGERYTVPGDVAAPLLWTGRPDALAITVGGQPVARLAESVAIMRDVPVTAEALLARGSNDAALVERPTGTPTN